MTLTVHLNECPKLPDGRVQHYFRRVDGVLVCQNGCGEEREHPFQASARKAVG